MSNRLATLKHHLEQTKYTKSSLSTPYISNPLDLLKISTNFHPNFLQIQSQLESYLLSEDTQYQILDCTERHIFPRQCLCSILNIVSPLLKRSFGNIDYVVLLSNILQEISKVDLTLAYIYYVQQCLVVDILQNYGSEDQNAKYLERLQNGTLVGGFCMSQLDGVFDGEDCIANEVRSSDQVNSYDVSGRKEWVWMLEDADVLILPAKIQQLGIISLFIIDKSTSGVRNDVFKRPSVFNIMKNGSMRFTNVNIKPEQQLLITKNVQTLQQQLNLAIELQSFIAVGSCIGIYKQALEYTRKRIQFQQPLITFPLVQEKIFRITAITTTLALLANRSLQLLLEQIKMKEHNSRNAQSVAFLSKSVCCEGVKRVARLGREVIGGNGIISDFHVIRYLKDAEGLDNAIIRYWAAASFVAKDVAGLLD